MRGVHDARILVVTQSPDRRSAARGAYRGGTGTRIMKIFLRPEYRIAADYPDYGRAGVPSFLSSMRIYQTSAVKCIVGGIPDALGERVIHNCRRRFLDAQVAELDDLELILPMGRLAIAAVLLRPQGSIDLRRTIGRRGVGIIETDSHYRKTVICLPHPSGTNRAFNPPASRPEDSVGVVRQKHLLAAALDAIRRRLKSMGYPLRDIPLETTAGPLDLL